MAAALGTLPITVMDWLLSGRTKAEAVAAQTLSEEAQLEICAAVKEEVVKKRAEAGAEAGAALYSSTCRQAKATMAAALGTLPITVIDWLLSGHTKAEAVAAQTLSEEAQLELCAAVKVEAAKQRTEAGAEAGAGARKK
eukprot:16357-Heterococcus_DN1.PRE.2